MDIPEEAERRYPNRNPGWGDIDRARMRGAFSEGAEWARKEALREAAQIAHMVHYAAECSTDGMLGPGMQSRSNAAFEIRNAIRALAEGDTNA
jgi:hypothetical protein